MGEVVLYASGSSARQTLQTKDRPVDATIMAIVDEVAVGDHVAVIGCGNTAIDAATQAKRLGANLAIIELES